MYDGAAAKTIAREQGLSPRDLASRVGVSERQMWRYESGSEPPFSVAARIAGVLGVPIDSLYVQDSVPEVPA